MFFFANRFSGFKLWGIKVRQRTVGILTIPGNEKYFQFSYTKTWLTCKKALHVTDPATESAEHTRYPASTFWAPCIRSVPSWVTWNRPYALPGNMSTCDPSRVQNTEGGGLPCATQSKFAIPFRPTFWSLGLVMNVGGAKTKQTRYLTNYPVS